MALRKKEGGRPGRLWLASLDFRRLPRRPVRLARTPNGYRIVLDSQAEALFCALAPRLTPSHAESYAPSILKLFDRDVELIPVHWQRNLEPLQFERQFIELRGEGYGTLTNDGPEFWIIERGASAIPHGRITKWPQVAKVEQPRAVQLRELHDFGGFGIIGGELDSGRRLYVLRPSWIYRKGELRAPVTDGHALSNDPVLDSSQGASVAGQFLPPRPFRFLTWKRYQAEILTALNQHAALIRVPVQDAVGRDLPWGSRKHATSRKPEVSGRELLAELATDAAQVVAMMGRGSKSPVGARPPIRKRRVRPWESGDEWRFRDQLDLELSAATLGAAGFDPFWDRYTADRLPHQSPRELLLNRAETYRQLRPARERRSPGGLSAWMLENLDYAWADREALRRFRVMWLHEQRVTRARRRGADLGGRPWKIQNAINGRWSAWQFPDYVTAELQTVRCHRRVGIGASPDDDYPDSQDWQERTLTGQMTSALEPEPDGETDDNSADDAAVLQLDGLTEKQLHQYLGLMEPAPGEPSLRDIENQARRREEFRHLAATFRTERGKEWLAQMLRGHSPASASREMGESPATGRKRWLRLRQRAQLMRARR